MTTHPHAVDLRRRAGWLPEDQDDLESWLDGHRGRAEGRGGQVVLHPVLTEFQELIDTDPVVRMYMNQMIAQASGSKPYRKRHLDSVEQMLRMINEVLTMAPEFSETAMVATLLGAILDWAMGTSAGLAAFRDPRVNAMFKKILSAWCEFLSSGDSLHVLNDSPFGWKSAEAQRTVGMEQYEHGVAHRHAAAHLRGTPRPGRATRRHRRRATGRPAADPAAGRPRTSRRAVAGTDPAGLLPRLHRRAGRQPARPPGWHRRASPPRGAVRAVSGSRPGTEGCRVTRELTKCPRRTGSSQPRVRVAGLAAAVVGRRDGQ